MIVSVGEEDVQIEAIVDQVARLRKLGDMQDWEEIEGMPFLYRIFSGMSCLIMSMNVCLIALLQHFHII